MPATKPSAVDRRSFLATTLALGIVIDAVIVRGLLAPALVAVLGPLNWTMPTPLARLLRVDPDWRRRPGGGRSL